MKSLYNVTEKVDNTTFEIDLLPHVQKGIIQGNRLANEFQNPKFIIIHEVSLCPDDQGFIMTYEEFINYWKVKEDSWWKRDKRYKDREYYFEGKKPTFKDILGTFTYAANTHEG